MFAKVFSQIYDSSIVENPEVRFTFMDLLVLADQTGVVDMTPEAIARRTNRPIGIIRETISVLESPDPRSRTPDRQGARLRRIDAHRDWGWVIVNYEKFREIASEQERRQYQRKWDREHAKTRHKSWSTRLKPDKTRHNPTNPTQAEANTEANTEACQNIELPAGFPATEQEAIERGMTAGADSETCRTAWNLAVGRGGVDSKGMPILSWAHYVKAASNMNGNRNAEREHRAKYPNAPTPSKTPEQRQYERELARIDRIEHLK